MLPKNVAAAAAAAKSRAGGATSAGGFRFEEDLKPFLFAFAGDLPAQRDTVELLNDICVDFIARTTAEAASHARSKRGNAVVDVDSLLHTQRHDAQRYERLLELQQSYHEIAKLKYLFKDAETMARKMPTALDSSSSAAAAGAGGASSSSSAGASAGDKQPTKRSKSAAGGSSSSKKKRVKEDHHHQAAGAAQQPASTGVSIVAASAAAFRNNNNNNAPSAALPAPSAMAPPQPQPPAEPSQTEFLL